MDLRDAVRMILGESAEHPELLRVTRQAYEELGSGRPAEHTALSWMLREAARKNLYPVLVRKHGTRTFHEMVTVMGREIDRQSSVSARRPH